MKWMLKLGVALGLWAGAAPAYIFLENSTDREVVVFSEKGQVWYQKCPPSVASVDTVGKMAPSDLHAACSNASGHKGYNVSESLFAVRASSLLGIPTQLFADSDGVNLLLDLATKEERSFRAREGAAGDSEWFALLSTIFQEVIDKLGPNNHVDFSSKQYPLSAYSGAVINAFSPAFYDGERAFKLAFPSKLGDGPTSCSSSWAYASVSALMETLGGSAGSDFIDWVKASLSANAALTVGAWQTFYEAKRTQGGFLAYVHYPASYVLTLSKQNLEAYAQVNAYFQQNKPALSANPAAAPGYNKFFQLTQPHTRAPVLCMRRVLPLEITGGSSKKGEVTFANLANRYATQENELFRYVLTDEKLAKELEPVRLGYAALAESELLSLTPTLDALMPSAHPDWATTEAAEAKERAAAKERARLAEIQRQREQAQRVRDLIASYTAQEERAEAQFDRFRDGPDETVLKACTLIYTNDIKIKIAIHWAGEFGYTVYGVWTLPAAQNGESCINVYVGTKLSVGSVYYYAWTGGSVWGKGDMNLLSRSYNSSTVTQADKRDPLQAGEQILPFTQWPMKSYNRVHEINLSAK